MSPKLRSALTIESISLSISEPIPEERSDIYYTVYKNTPVKEANKNLFISNKDGITILPQRNRTLHLCGYD